MIFIHAAILYALFFLVCFLGTGSDEKNIKSYASYPDKIKGLVRLRPSLAAKIKTVNPWVSFFSNFAVFTVVLFLFGFTLRTGSFWLNFCAILALGEGLNLFDLFIIDLLWWRNSKRIHFSFIENQDELYRDPKNHILSFLRAIPMFILVAAADGFLLTLF